MSEEAANLRSLRGKLAAHARWAKEPDRLAALAPAKAARDQQFIDLVDPDRTLPEAERALRVGSARRAHFMKLAYLSAKARQAGSRRERSQSHPDNRHGECGGAL